MAAIRWKQLTQPQVLAVPIALAKKHCRVIDLVTVATQSNLLCGSGNAQLFSVAKMAGSYGNQYSVEIIASGNSSSLSVSLVDTSLTINLATNNLGAATSTVEQVIAALYSNNSIASVFNFSSGDGDGSGVLSAHPKTFLTNGLDSGDEDGYLELLILAATEVLEALTSKAFITRNFRMYMDEWSDDEYTMLPLNPVSAVSAINYIDDFGNSQSAMSLFEIDIFDESLPPRIKLKEDYVYPVLEDQMNAITIDFTAGYGDSPNDIPAKIKQCILFLVAHWYSAREPVISGTATLSNAIPFTFKTTLNSFKMVTV